MQQSEKNRCPCCESSADPDLTESFQLLSMKFNQMADLIRLYMEQAPLERRIRNANAVNFARIIERIVGGLETDKSEYPECCLVGVVHPNRSLNWFCSGVLVSEDLVLTAGHCITPSNTSPYVVAIGATNSNNLESAEIIEAKKAIAHPNYLSMKINDIGALVLESKSKKEPAPIATAEELSDAAEVTLVGFGNSDFLSTRGFGIQRKVTVVIRAVRKSPHDNLDESEKKYGFESDYEFVAGGEGYDSCNGDSGGPAYITVDGHKRVAGLTSRGVKTVFRPCGDGGIYTRPDAHMDFLDRITDRYRTRILGT